MHTLRRSSLDGSFDGVDGNNGSFESLNRRSSLHIDDTANGLFGTRHAATAFDDVDVFERGPQISPIVD